MELFLERVAVSSEYKCKVEEAKWEVVELERMEEKASMDGIRLRNEEQRETPIVVEFDPDNRDPYLMNQFLRLSFMDIIAEPDEDSYSKEGVYKTTYQCFTKTKGCCYRILTLLCAVPISFCIGCHFACWSFAWIWCLRPYLKHFELFMIFYQKIYSTVVRAIFVPMFSAVAYVFSKIRIATTSTTELVPLVHDL